MRCGLKSCAISTRRESLTGFKSAPGQESFSLHHAGRYRLARVRTQSSIRSLNFAQAGRSRRLGRGRGARNQKRACNYEDSRLRMKEPILFDGL
jgi:hypothetical protein